MERERDVWLSSACRSMTASTHRVGSVRPAGPAAGHQSVAARAHPRRLDRGRREDRSGREGHGGVEGEVPVGDQDRGCHRGRRPLRDSQGAGGRGALPLRSRERHGVADGCLDDAWRRSEARPSAEGGAREDLAACRGRSRESGASGSGGAAFHEPVCRGSPPRLAAHPYGCVASLSRRAPLGTLWRACPVPAEVWHCS